MLVFRTRHYLAALLVLICAVAVVARKSGAFARTSPSSAALTERTAPSAVSEGSEASNKNAGVPETAPASEPPAAEKPLIGVWFPYMSLVTSEHTEASFRSNYESLLDAAEEMQVNAVFVHVRPFADSLYPSEFEPWSHILTGVQGEDPGFDPLAYMVEAAHSRNMAFHAWINPLRISTGSTPPQLSEESFYMTRKDSDPYFFIEYDGGIYYNPASAEIRERIADGAAEIAEKYDVDGIHFDDYFYPTDDESIDSAQYEAYAENTEEPLPLHEWRTANVNALIATVYHRIKSVDSDVAFGISPQGNLRNNEKINADVPTWCAQAGYIDYICPQLYYSPDNPALGYGDALQEWVELPRREDVRFYIGLAVYKAGTDADEGTWLGRDDILEEQITRASAAGADGILFYAIGNFGGGEAAAELANAEIAVEKFENGGRSQSNG